MTVTRRHVVRLALALPFVGFASLAAQEKSASVYVFGFVRNAGAYPYKDNMTVGDALEAAGGFAPNRNVSGILIIRITNGEKEELNVALTDTVLPGDSVVVR